MFRVKSWERFEAARVKDRPRRRMDWASLPCDLNSTGYGILMGIGNGAQHLGVFVAMIQLVASLPIQFRDGSLISQQGIALSTQAIAVKARISQVAVEESLTALMTCGWITDECESSGDFPGISGNLGDSPGVARNSGDSPGVQGQGHVQGQKETPASGDARLTDYQSEWFESWWSGYWLKKDRGHALTAFRRHVKTEQLFSEVMAAMDRQRAEMLSRKPEHRPYGATWLNGQRWLDEATPAQRDAIDEAAENLEWK